MKYGFLPNYLFKKFIFLNKKLSYKVNMKNFLCFLWATYFLCCAISCNKDNIVSNLLIKAETLMNESSDSSLFFLLQIENPKNLSDGQYALWCLLYTQAKDKNFETHTSDSLISIAVNYFEKGKDKHNLMRSYYYAAVTWDDIGDSPRAQDFYLKASDLAKDMHDNDFIGRIYSNLGSIYLYQDILTTALEYEKKAAEIFSFLNDTTNMAISYQNIGRIFIRNNNLDSALMYYTKTLPLLAKYDSVIIFNEIGSLYSQKGEYDKALTYIKRALSMSVSDNDKLFIYHNLGNLYQLSGKSDSAKYYLSKCIQSSNIYTKSAAYFSLASLEEKMESWSAFISYYREFRQLQDTISKANQSEYLNRIQGMFNYQQAEKERFYYKQEADRKTIYYYRLIIALLIVISASVCIIYFYRKKKQLELEQKEKEIKDQSKKLEQSEATLLLLKRKYLIQKDSAEEFFSSELYEKMSEKKNPKLKEKDWNDFEVYVNRIHPGITERIKTKIPRIDDFELRLCYFKRLNFMSVNQISKLFNILPQAVSNKWTRLNNKIKTDKNNYKDIDDFIANI